MKDSSGNIIFIIFTAVVLFGALTFVATSGNKSSKTGLIEHQSELDESVIRACNTSVNAAITRLKANKGCKTSEISYELPSGDNPNPDAPNDKSCHVFDSNGAGLEPCGTHLIVSSTCLQGLVIGESCDGIIYAGMSGGNRIYTTPNDESPDTWNNGTMSWSVTNATSMTDGITNTDTLVGLSDSGAPYGPAGDCRALGSEWYLPARSELLTLYTNRSAIGNFISDERYWSSTEGEDDKAWVVRFRSGGETDDRDKTESNRFRCIRQD